MKSLKSVLLSAITLGAVVAPAQAGYTYNGYHLMDGSDFKGYEMLATPMIESLTKLGVPVVDGGKNNVPMCTPQGNKQTLGFYIPGDNVMVVCTTAIPVWLQMETLTHETVHVIQDARAGINNEDMEEAPLEHLNQLLRGLDQQKVNIIYNFYEESEYGVEVEAFYFETRPQVVVNEIQRWAF